MSGDRAPDRLSVAVFGADGRMGQLVCAAVDARPDLDLVARITRADSPELATTADVIVDFTTPASALVNLEWAIAAGKHAVIGTTGLGDAAVDRIRDRLVDSVPPLGVYIVPNFSVSAFLARKMGELAMSHYASVEIIEYAHEKKVEAPSGTALDVAKRLSHARKAAGMPPFVDDPSQVHGGIRGANPTEIPIHSVRVKGMVNHQEILLGREGEFMSIRYDTMDRQAYMPGVVETIRDVVTRPGLHLSLGVLYDDPREH